jgi:DNA modification methylase
MINVHLKQADCLQFLSGLESESVELVLVDPPYHIGYDVWDNQWASEKDYLEWCREWTAEAVRVLKPHGMLCVWGTLKTDTFLRYKLQVLNELKDLKSQNEIVWSYNWGGRTKKNFARKHEFIWCYSKGIAHHFDADAVRIPRKQKINIRTGKPFANGTVPTCVWEKNNHTTSVEYCSWHKTQKPIALLERIIKAYTKPGDTVLDFFCGAGSTCVAAVNCGRNFIGCEIDKDYLEKSKVRIDGLTTNKFSWQP